MVKIVWSILANDDLGEIESYISNHSITYAIRTIEKIFSRVEIVKEFPKSGRVVPEFNNHLIRELIEGNYRIVYFINSSKQVTILRIHHASRLLKS